LSFSEIALYNQTWPANLESITVSHLVILAWNSIGFGIVKAFDNSGVLIRDTDFRESIPVE
jgi:hypothetical protein